MDSSVSPKKLNLVSARVPSHLKGSLTLVVREGLSSNMRSNSEIILLIIEI